MIDEVEGQVMQTLHPLGNISMSSRQSVSLSIVNHQFSLIQKYSEHVSGLNRPLFDWPIDVIDRIADISQTIAVVLWRQSVLAEPGFG
jgi:hypothetical protein